MFLITLVTEFLKINTLDWIKQSASLGYEIQTWSGNEIKDGTNADFISD